MYNIVHVQLRIQLNTISMQQYIIYIILKLYMICICIWSLSNIVFFKCWQNNYRWFKFLVEMQIWVDYRIFPLKKIILQAKSCNIWPMTFEIVNVKRFGQSCCVDTTRARKIELKCQVFKINTSWQNTIIDMVEMQSPTFWTFFSLSREQSSPV